MARKRGSDLATRDSGPRIFHSDLAKRDTVARKRELQMLAKRDSVARILFIVARSAAQWHEIVAPIS